MSKLEIRGRLSRCEAWSTFREDFERLTVALISRGGKIVSTATLSAGDIAWARHHNRMVVDPDGFGFVWIPDPARIKRCEDWILP